MVIFLYWYVCVNWVDRMNVVLRISNFVGWKMCRFCLKGKEELGDSKILRFKYFWDVFSYGFFFVKSINWL